MLVSLDAFLLLMLTACDESFTGKETEFREILNDLLIHLLNLEIEINWC